MTTRTDRNQVFNAAGVLLSETVVVVDTTAETNRDATRVSAEQAIAGLRLIAASTGDLSPTQLSNGMRLLARVALHVVRIILDRHDQVN